jgi:sugar porter (SP) family MFS transporter
MSTRSYVFLISLVAAMGGFLFGFDTAVISGAEQTIQTLWQLTPGFHGFVVATALYGTVLGALLGAIPTDAIGRRQTLLWVGILYFVSALGSALAPEVYSFMFFRFIGGLGVGTSTIAAPLYISEISPAHSRGKLVALFQFNVVLGILIAFVSNYWLERVGMGWRWMLGVEAFPALLFCILIPFIPRSPRWLLVRRHDEAAAREVLKRVDPANVESAIAMIKEDHSRLQQVHRVGLFSGGFARPIRLAIAFAFLNQLAGINAIIYYAPRIFESGGLGNSAAFASTMGIGLVNLIFTLVGISLIDSTGRRKLMIWGSFGLIVCLGLIARAFLTTSFDGLSYFFFAYIAFFALSQGTVIWVFISEIFPNEVRAAGQSLGSFTHWMLAALIANAFPYFAAKLGQGAIFSFFTLMMVMQLLFVWKIMPETKGRSLEDLGHGL